MLTFPPYARKVKHGKLILIKFSLYQPGICRHSLLPLPARARWKIPNLTRVLLAIITLELNSHLEIHASYEKDTL